MVKKNWFALVTFLLVPAATQMTLIAGTRVQVGFGFGYRGPAVVPHVRVVTAYRWYGHGFRAHRVEVVPGNVGRVDFNVKPGNSEIFVDGAFLGIADDYDGGFFGTTASLRAGVHHVRVVSPRGQVLTRQIYVQPGKAIDFNWIF